MNKLAEFKKLEAHSSHATRLDDLEGDEPNPFNRLI